MLKSRQLLGRQHHVVVCWFNRLALTFENVAANCPTGHFAGRRGHVVRGRVPRLLSNKLLRELDITMRFRDGSAQCGALEKDLTVETLPSGHSLLKLDQYP